MKIFGFVPARMAASRFPGKPLAKICGRPMIEHVIERALLYDKWDRLFLTTCDPEIETFGIRNGFPVVLTSPNHTRCLDRVAEAATICGEIVSDEDLLICVQGDEPMLHPEMIETVVQPLMENPNVPGTILAMPIKDANQFENPDIVKIVANNENEVLYTSRAPIPFGHGEFSEELGALRVGGIFGFRSWFLSEFVRMPEGRLEKLESCDSNRILDSSNRQHVATYPYKPYYSVDSPDDIARVEAYIAEDEYWGKY